ncbi:PA4780 family RIO1-like protein kinase [Methylophilus medardicus]|uniref:non-specific serine/threonine protein kinase n=1 Tax=Methylophilus medardicus TaxID=2588534 RepID=A0A5B8CUB0_9PROT|nr:PA4780 family RIO1-like protein kinase [Methylophilus medardicus]QDC44908.1 serine protein kinase RIO [Methylophilus medardicus]QDC49915.1 serine protein kinase RIO [Methylophilus medardicus]QDC53620.1 serine protein kinase RIO [Methylophilus medardicus]
MKTPTRLAPLIEDGIVDEVIRQLMSGKEATVYVVRCGEEIRCAKVYKEANKRSFRQSVDYTEGRKVKSSRQARAMAKGSKYGKQAQEEAWQSAEVDALYRLAAAGVSVPTPYQFYEGVLIMDLVTDAAGNAAPRLNDVVFTAEEARQHHQSLLKEVVRMLCAGIVHGDLSEFNILLSAHGPIIIDLPQAVDAAGNNHAMSMLERDVRNLADFFGQFAPELLSTQYGKEIWALYAHGALTPETVLTGQFKQDNKPVDLKSVVRVIDAVRDDEAKKQMRLAEAKAALPKPKRF